MWVRRIGKTHKQIRSWQFENRVYVLSVPFFFLIISSVFPCRVNNSKCRSDGEIVFLQTTSSLPVSPFLSLIFFSYLSYLILNIA